MQSQFLPLKFRLLILKFNGANGFEDTIWPPDKKNTNEITYNRPQGWKGGQEKVNLCSLLIRTQWALLSNHGGSIPGHPMDNKSTGGGMLS